VYVIYFICIEPSLLPLMMAPWGWNTSGVLKLLVIKAVGCTCLIDIRLHSMKDIKNAAEYYRGVWNNKSSCNMAHWDAYHTAKSYLCVQSQTRLQVPQGLHCQPLLLHTNNPSLSSASVSCQVHIYSASEEWVWVATRLTFLCCTYYIRTAGKVFSHVVFSTTQLWTVVSSSAP
jgi:hypothetical protein